MLWAELCPLKIPPQNVTVFGDRAFTEVIKLE